MDSIRSPQVKALGKAVLVACLPFVCNSAFLSQNNRPQMGGLGPSAAFGTEVSGAVFVALPQRPNGAPYSAEKETETIQTLGDGTHITRKSRMRLYRDSLGRTRTEIFAPEGPGAPQEPTSINISDPVERVNYYLNPSSHTGTRNVFPVPPNNPPQPPKRSVNVTPPPMSRELMPQSHSEDLGMQMIEGVWVRGMRSTTTIPANAQGNDQPLVEVFENWFSEELQVQVLSKRSDPRFGETTERLININRSEPDPTLFQPPADYTITEPPRTY